VLLMPFNAPPREPMGSQGPSSNRDSPPPRRYKWRSGTYRSTTHLETSWQIMHNSRFILCDRTDSTCVIRLHLPLRLGGTIASRRSCNLRFPCTSRFREARTSKSPPPSFPPPLLAFQPHHTALCLCELPISGCCILSSTGLDLRSF